MFVTLVGQALFTWLSVAPGMSPGVRNIRSFFLSRRTQSRIGSPVPPQHTGPSRTVRRYPASHGQLTSNALPNGHGHEQSSSGPHAVSQEHTLAARGKACRGVTLSGLLLVSRGVTGGPRHPYGTLEVGRGEESSAPRGRREQNGEKLRTEERGVRTVMLLSVVKKETLLKGRKMLAAGEM